MKKRPIVKVTLVVLTLVCLFTFAVPIFADGYTQGEEDTMFAADICCENIIGYYPDKSWRVYDYPSFYKGSDANPIVGRNQLFLGGQLVSSLEYYPTEMYDDSSRLMLKLSDITSVEFTFLPFSMTAPANTGVTWPGSDKLWRLDIINPMGGVTTRNATFSFDLNYKTNSGEYERKLIQFTSEVKFNKPGSDGQPSGLDVMYYISRNIPFEQRGIDVLITGLRITLDSPPTFDQGWMTVYMSGSFDNEYNYLNSQAVTWFRNQGLKYSKPLLPDDVDWTTWLVNSIGGIINFQIFPHFTIGGVLGLVVGISLLILVLKAFAGG